MKTSAKLLNEITFDKVRPYIHTSRTRIRKYNVDFIVGLVIHRIRKIVRRAEQARKPKRRYCYEIVSEFKEIGVIGFCWGEDGKRDVLAEEPKVSFRRISRKEHERRERIEEKRSK